MSFTFGAATTDNIAFTGLDIAPLTTNRTSLFTCWVRPTTLTAGRVIWATGAVMTFAIDTTTSSARLTLDCATTDGTYIAPVGLAVNTWTFLAVLANLGTGPTATVKMWAGTESSQPVEKTVTASAGTGAFVSGGTALTVGNANAGSLAFQGDIGGMVIASDSLTSVFNSLCGIVADGTISQAQADQVLGQHVGRLWRGDLSHMAGAGRALISNGGFGWLFAASLDSSSLVANSPYALWQSRGLVRGTASGATKSTLITPRSFADTNDNFMAPRRRRGFLARAS